MTEANITKKETLSCDQVSLVEIVGVELVFFRVLQSIVCA